MILALVENRRRTHNMLCLHGFNTRKTARLIIFFILILIGALNFACTKKSRGLKTSAFMLFIMLPDREPAFYHRSHFTVSWYFYHRSHFYRRSAFLRRKDYSSVKASLLRPHTGQTQYSGTSSHLVPGATPLSGSPRVSS